MGRPVGRLACVEQVVGSQPASRGFCQATALIESSTFEARDRDGAKLIDSNDRRHTSEVGATHRVPRWIGHRKTGV